ncbi:MAG TPA: hypothetical protein VFX12_04475 [Vicinamibacterales bacterium]|nr:hypothetical protein [Vicinamibacterales bacterium]
MLTPEAFEFVLDNELKRAARSQNFLTLVLVDPRPSAPEETRGAAARQIARLISREVRETDLLSANDDGRLSVVLLDADLPNSLQVIERLMTRLANYDFETPVAIHVGAACCPTHGADAETLRRAAASRTVTPARDARGNASNAQ